MDMSIVYFAGTFASLGAMEVIAFRDKPHSNTKFVLACMCLLGCFAGTLGTHKNNSQMDESSVMPVKNADDIKLKHEQSENKPLQIDTSSSANKTVSFRFYRDKSHGRV